MIFKTVTRELFGDHEVSIEERQCCCLVAEVSEVTPSVCFTLYFFFLEKKMC